VAAAFAMIALLAIDSVSKEGLAPSFLPYATKAEEIVSGWVSSQALSGIMYEYEIASTTKSFNTTNDFADASVSYASSWHNYGLAIKFNVRLKTANSQSLVEYSEGMFDSVASYIYNNYRYDVAGMPGSTSDLIWGGLTNNNPSIWYFEWHPGFEVSGVQDYRTQYLNKIFASSQSYNPLSVYNGYIQRNISNLSAGQPLEGFTDQENLTLAEYYGVYKMRKEINGVSAIGVSALAQFVESNPYSTYYEYMMADLSGNFSKSLILKRYLQVFNIYSIISDSAIRMPDVSSNEAVTMVVSSGVTDDVGFVPVGLTDISGDDGDDQGLLLTATFTPRIDGDKIIALDDDGRPVYYKGNIEMTYDICGNNPNDCIGDFGSVGRLKVLEYDAAKASYESYGRPDRISRYFVSNRNVDGSVDVDIDPMRLDNANKEMVGGIPVIRTAEEEMITPPGAPNIMYPKGVVEVSIPAILDKKNTQSSNTLIW
jgi:hypothetical protein